MSTGVLVSLPWVIKVRLCDFFVMIEPFLVPLSISVVDWVLAAKNNDPFSFSSLIKYPNLSQKNLRFYCQPHCPFPATWIQNTTWVSAQVPVTNLWGWPTFWEDEWVQMDPLPTPSRFSPAVMSGPARRRQIKFVSKFDSCMEMTISPWGS